MFKHHTFYFVRSTTETATISPDTARTPRTMQTLSFWDTSIIEGPAIELERAEAPLYEEENLRNHTFKGLYTDLSTADIRVTLSVGKTISKYSYTKTLAKSLYLTDTTKTEVRTAQKIKI